MASPYEHGRKGGGSGCAKGCLGAFVVIVVLLVAAAMIAGLYIQRLEDATEVRNQAIRDAGEPATLADIDGWIGAVEDENNAAIPLQAAIDAHHEPSNHETLMPFVGGKQAQLKPTEPISEELRAEIEAYLLQEEKSLQSVSEAVKLSACRFPLNYSMGYSVELPHLAGLRSLQRVECLKATYESELGKSEEAVQTILAAARLSEATSKEPLLISQLVRIAMHAILVSGLEQCFNRTSFTSDRLKQIQDAIQAINTGDCIYTGLLGERCMFMDALSGNTPLGEFGLPSASWGPLAWRNRVDQEYGLEMLDEMIKAAKLPPEEGRALSEKLYNEADFENRGRLRQFLTIVSDLQIPSLGRAMEAQARDTSLLNCAVSACAILRYWQDRGTLPDTLDELVPQYLDKTPLDCMDAKPLRYLHDEMSFTVYTVGPNRKDDGGTSPAEGEKITETGDMLFTVQLRKGAGV
ncbi:MAG: hypothetical protein K1Y02_14390 [Candidatus Hydrogenedentes bacterium]|nr:hypothetical protein [Candidatus Hydrogenedentota bacterium]